MCEVGRSGYIILYFTPSFLGPALRDTKALFLQLQLQMQIFSSLHSVSAVVGEVIVGM